MSTEGVQRLQPHTNPTYRFVKCVCCRLIESGKQVPIGVQGGSDRGVPHPLLNHLGMETFPNQDGGGSMPEIVKRARLAHRGSDCWIPDSSPVIAATESASIRSGEEEATRSRWVLGNVVFEMRGDETGKS